MRKTVTALLTTLRAGQRQYITRDELSNIDKAFIAMEYGNGLIILTDKYHSSLMKKEFKICGLFQNKDLYAIDDYAMDIMSWTEEDKHIYEEVAGLHNWYDTKKENEAAINNKIKELSGQKSFMDFETVDDEFKERARERAWRTACGFDESNMIHLPQYKLEADTCIDIVLGVTSVDEIAQRFYEEKEEDIQWARNVIEYSKQNYDFTSEPLILLMNKLIENKCVNINVEFENEDKTASGVVVAESLIYSIRNNQNISEWNGFKNRDEGSRVAHDLGSVRDILPSMITKVTYKKKTLYNKYATESDNKVASWIKNVEEVM